MSDDVIGRTLPPTSSALSALVDASSRTTTGRPGARWARRYVRGRRATDLLAILIAIAAVPVLGQFWPAGVGAPDTAKLTIGVVLSVVWFAALRVGRLPEVRSVVAERHEYRDLTVRSLAVFGVLAVAAVVVVHLPGIRWDLLITLPLGLTLLLLSRSAWAARLRSRRSVGLDLARAVIVGSSRDVESVAHSLASAPRTWSTVAVVLTDADAAAAGSQESPFTFAGIDAVADAVAISSADTVVLAGQPNDGGVLVRDLAWRLESTPADLVLASSLEGIGAARLSFQPVDGLSMVHVTTPVFAGGKHHLKRLTDVVLAGTAIVLLAPLFAAIALCIRITSRGPVFFRQTRVGRNGTEFSMLKFRSMRVGADREHAILSALNDGNGVLFKLREDPRVTRVGRLLRRYSLDELPQIWNVLRGDMSLVGPRPPLASEVERYDGHVHRRLYIKPGLTGLWQVSGRSDLTWEQSVRLDLFYVANWSPLGDIKIMARTVKVVLRRDGAY